MVDKGSPYISSTNVTKNPQNVTEEEKISGPNNISFSHNSSNKAPASSGLRGDGYERALLKWKHSHLDLVEEDQSNEDANVKESLLIKEASKEDSSSQVKKQDAKLSSQGHSSSISGTNHDVEESQTRQEITTFQPHSNNTLLKKTSNVREVPADFIRPYEEQKSDLTLLGSEAVTEQNEMTPTRPNQFYLTANNPRHLQPTQHISSVSPANSRLQFPQNSSSVLGQSSYSSGRSE